MSVKRGHIIGIDLGTTHTLAAWMSPEGPRVLRNALGRRLTPSAVAFDEEGRLLVGRAAKARGVTHPHLSAEGFKRQMGLEITLQLGARALTPQALSAILLAQIKADAEQALGGPVEEAVISVPAHFDDRRRQATRDAAEIAGLHVERLVNEPTAAALAYGLHRRGGARRVAVLDLGGGTFDVSVLEIIDGIIEIQATAGDLHLGGLDFDLAMYGLWRAESPGLPAPGEGDPRILRACERARVQLSRRPEASARWEKYTHTWTRAEAERAWAPLFERMRLCIQRALRDAELSPDEIDDVVLVGGATRMPSVIRLAAQHFGKLPERSLEADEAVALGVAIQAALKAGDDAVGDLVVTDVAPFTLGIATVVEMGRHRVDGIFAPIIDRGAVIPTSRVERFTTANAGQREIKIEVFQGEGSLCRDNEKIGEYVVRDLPVGGAGAISIDVRFTCDLNGILEVETVVGGAGPGQVLLIERSPGRLSPQALAQARQAMSSLKFHPREALPHTTLLARAEAAHLELTGGPRARLARRLAHFRAALETQESEYIEAAARALSALVDELEG